MNKKRIRLLVDIGMVILLPLLMAYSLIGEKFHEMIGTVMAVLFVIHLIQNRKWVAGACRSVACRTGFTAEENRRHLSGMKPRQIGEHKKFTIIVSTLS